MPIILHCLQYETKYRRSLSKHHDFFFAKSEYKIYASSSSSSPPPQPQPIFFVAKVSSRINPRGTDVELDRFGPTSTIPVAYPQPVTYGRTRICRPSHTTPRESIEVSQCRQKGGRGGVEGACWGGRGEQEGAKALLSCREATGKTSLHFAAAMGRSKTCEYILDVAPKAYAERDEQGNVPMHMACRGGHVDVVELLLRKGSKPNDANNSGVCPLHHVDEPKIVEILCKAGADPNFSAKEGGSPLHFAVADGHTSVMLS